MGLIHTIIESHSLKLTVNTLKYLPRVHFHKDLLAFSNEKIDLPNYLRQIALETLSDFLSKIMQIFTDGMGIPVVAPLLKYLLVSFQSRL